MKHLMGPRMTTLLKGAAKAFTNGSGPFSTWCLSQNEVTADECLSMSDIIGSVIEWFTDQPLEVQENVLLYGFHPQMAREIKQGETVDKSCDSA